MPNPKVEIVYASGCWQGLYIDGELYHEDESISTEVLLRALGIEWEQVEADEAWFEGRECLPLRIEELNKEEEW